MPEPNSFLVEPRVTISDSVYFKLFLAKGELPVECNQHISKSLSCELRFISTNGWTSGSPSTAGIVHIRTSSNHYIPLSVVGLSFDKLKTSNKLFTQVAAARISSSGVLGDFYTSYGTCIQKELSSDNLLELMKDDALVSSLMRTFSKMAPKWLVLATREENRAFDIQNIKVNLATKSLLKEEHYSDFQSIVKHCLLQINSKIWRSCFRRCSVPVCGRRHLLCSRHFQAICLYTFFQALSQWANQANSVSRNER